MKRQFSNITEEWFPSPDKGLPSTDKAFPLSSENVSDFEPISVIQLGFLK